MGWEWLRYDLSGPNIFFILVIYFFAAFSWKEENSIKTINFIRQKTTQNSRKTKQAE